MAARSAYVHAALGAEGLGHFLIPWARAEVFRRDHELPMLAPQWTWPRLAHLRERDPRLYPAHFSSTEYIRGLRRLWILATAKSTPAESFGLGQPAGTVIVFKGRDEWLTGLASDRDYIRRRVEAILSRRVREKLWDNPGRDEIAAHIRRGDKPTIRIGDPFPGDRAFGLPDEWFIAAIRSARAAAGRNVPVRVYSDAPPYILRSILTVGNITVAPPGPAIVDLLLMSRARVLLTTGTSLFSWWASYLGDPVTIAYPGILGAARPDWDGAFFETDLGGNLSSKGREHVARALARRPKTEVLRSPEPVVTFSGRLAPIAEPGPLAEARRES